MGGRGELFLCWIHWFVERIIGDIYFIRMTGDTTLRLTGIFWGILIVMGLLMRPAQAADLDLTAQAAIVVEASTGRIVYEKNSADRNFPASTTKMVTLLVALENGKLDDIVTVSPAAAGQEGSGLGLRAGDRIRFSELLEGMMLVSGNDAAFAAAEHLAGSAAAFMPQMNELALRAGAYHTHFANPTGLTQSDHYTTAADLAKIALYGLRNDEFSRIVGLEKKTVRWEQPAGKMVVAENTNELLGHYPGADGVKTGYTQAAGECLVASAKRDGVELVAVVMHAADDRRFLEAGQLLDYGFLHVRRQKAADRDELVHSIHVHGGTSYQLTGRPAADIYYPLLNGEAGGYSLKYDLPRYVNAPVKAGDRLGDICILYNGQEVSRVPLLADAPVHSGFSLLALLVQLYDGIAALLPV